MSPEQLAFVRKTTPPIPRLKPTTGLRPFWSVIIPTHNRSRFLPFTLASVLAQDPGPENMQIEVMDDGSNDPETRTLVRNMGGGRIGYTCQPRNLGQFRNVNDGIRRSRGHWVHVLHDDDWVLPDFYATLQASLALDRPPGAVLTSITVCDEQGKPIVDMKQERSDPGLLDEWLFKTATSARIQTPAVVVRREVYETLGGYRPEFPWPGDWEMWQRIAAHFPWWYEPGARACYRQHGSSVSGEAKRSGRNIAEARAVVDYAQHYVPRETAPAIREAALRFWTEFAYATAKHMIETGDFLGAAAQLAECLRTVPSAEVVRAVITMGSRLRAK